MITRLTRATHPPTQFLFQFPPLSSEVRNSLSFGVVTISALPCAKQAPTPFLYLNHILNFPTALLVSRSQGLPHMSVVGPPSNSNPDEFFC